MAKVKKKTDTYQVKITLSKEEAEGLHALFFTAVSGGALDVFNVRGLYAALYKANVGTLSEKKFNNITTAHATPIG